MARRPNQSVQTKTLLANLLQRPLKWHHGYDLSKETGLKSGVLYPLLIRLSDQGYLESRWEEPERQGRPPRHMYRLTSAGIELACNQSAELQQAFTHLEGAPV